MDREESFTPKALETQPEVEPDMVELVDAFQILSSRRGKSETHYNPIPFMDLGMHLAVYGIPWCGKDSFIRLMIQLDNQFLKKANSSE